MRRPLCIHLLELLQRFHGLIDGATQRRTVLVVKELVHMTCQRALLVLRRWIGLSWAYWCVLRREAVGRWAWMPRILHVSIAS
jgi:hypothetical protein